MDQKQKKSGEDVELKFAAEELAAEPFIHAAADTFDDAFTSLIEMLLKINGCMKSERRNRTSSRIRNRSVFMIFLVYNHILWNWEVSSDGPHYLLSVDQLHAFQEYGNRGSQERHKEIQQ